MDSSVFDLAQFTLGTAVTGASRLAQEVVTDATVTGIPALTAHQLAQSALCSDHTLTGRLLEQTSGEVFDVGVVAQARTVEQPQGNFQGKALWGGNSVRGIGNRR